MQTLIASRNISKKQKLMSRACFEFSCSIIHKNDVGVTGAHFTQTATPPCYRAPTISFTLRQHVIDQRLCWVRAASRRRKNKIACWNTNERANGNLLSSSLSLIILRICSDLRLNAGATPGVHICQHNNLSLSTLLIQYDIWGLPWHQNLFLMWQLLNH